MTVPAGGDSGFVKINVTGSTGTNCALVHNVVWFDGPGVEKTITVKYFDWEKKEIGTENLGRKKSPRGTSQCLWWWGTLDSIYKVPAGDGTYYMKLFNESDSPQLCHIYFRDLYDSGYAVQFDAADRFYTVTAPAEADRAIAIGAYTHRNEYVNYLGNTITTGQTIGGIASFSSRGPRVDTYKQAKPFIVSPGSRVISCRDRIYVPLDSDSISDSGVNDGSGPADYAAWDGTSMATPIAAGCVALMMQSYPGLKGKPELIKQYLRQSASKSSRPDWEWGYGLFSLQKVVQLLPKKATVTTSAGQNMTYTTDLGTISSLRAASTLPGNMTTQGFLPWGAYTCDISLLEPSGRANIDVSMPSDAPDEYLAYTGGHWAQVPLAADRGTELDMRLVDGGPADSDRDQDGDIELTGGPAIEGLLATFTGARGSGGISASVAAPPPVIAPSITVQSAALSGSTLMPGETVRITVSLVNTSTVSGQFPVTVYVNGEAALKQAVSVGGSQSVSKEYTLKRDDPGTYRVVVNSVPAGTFTIEDPASAELPVTATLIILLGGIALVSTLLWRRCRSGM